MIHLHLNHLAVRLLYVLDKRTPSGWSDKRQNTDVHSFYWVHEGKGTFQTESGEAYQVREGNLFYLHPGLRLYMESDQEYPLHMTMVLTDLALLPYENKAWGAVQPLDSLKLPFVQHYMGEQAKHFHAHFRDLYNGWVSGEHAGTFKDQNKVIELIHSMFEMKPHSKDRPAYSAYLTIKAYLETHYSSEIKLNQLAELTGISESYIRKMFIKLTSQSPKRYLHSIRIGHAKRMLMYTDMPMKEIAAACGFADEFHFSKMFKLFTGASPSKFRDQT